MEFKISDTNQLYSLSLLHILSKVVTLSAELKLDNYLSEKLCPIDDIANQLNLHKKALYRFLRVLDAYEIVELIGNDHVRSGKFLSYLSKIRSPHILDSYKCIENLMLSLQDNKECYSKTFGKAFYPYLLDNAEKLQQFEVWNTNSAQDWLPSIFSLYDFSKFNTLVDVGGGQGYFLASILEKYPEKTGILFDQPQVVKHAFDIFTQYKVSKRVKVVGGDFFDSIPSGGDVYTVCRTLLNWDDKDAIAILDNCYKAMADNSTLLIIDFIIPDKDHPQYKIGIINDLNLLTCVNSANRTQQEWCDLISQSQFRLKNIYITSNDVIPQPIIPMIILEAVKGCT